MVGENEGWRFFTCMFLHAGVVHLLANMFSLLFIGVRLENEFGFRKHVSIETHCYFLCLVDLFMYDLLDSAVKIGLLYLFSGFGGSLLSILHLGNGVVPNTISVGASGALFGLLGAMLSELLTNWTIYLNKVLSNNITCSIEKKEKKRMYECS